MRALVIGSGMLGSRISWALKAEYEDIKRVETTRSFDITNHSQVKDLIIHEYPNVIFLCAAMTNVDECEKHQHKSKATNLIAVKNITDIAKTLNSHLIFYSTNYVFDGEDGSYSETDIPNPLNVYGRHKLCSEYYIRNTLEKYSIIRTSTVYSSNYKSIPRIIEDIGSGTYFAATDIDVSPTYAEDLAKYSCEIAASQHYGVHHFTGGRDYSRCDYIKQIARIFGLDSNNIIPSTQIELKEKFPNMAWRPQYSNLKCKINGKTSLEDGLKAIKQKLNH